jgi:hypothetical protein
MSDVDNLKNKALIISQSRNFMSRTRNKLVTEMTDEILNNPTLFNGGSEVETEQFASSATFIPQPISGVTSDAETIGGGVIIADTSQSVNFTFNFDNIQEGSKIRMRYKSDAPIECYIEYPVNSATYSPLFFTFPSTNNNFISFDIPWDGIANYVVIGESAGINLFQASVPTQFELDYIALII